MARKPVTRETNYVKFIGYPLESITGAQLPCARKVLQNLFFYHKVQKLTLSESLSYTYNNVITFWEMVGIPTTYKCHVITKIKTLFNNYKSLIKSWKRKNNKERLKQQNFSSKLDSLFDISHADLAINKKYIKDLQFLNKQREGIGSIGGIDKNHERKEKRK